MRFSIYSRLIWTILSKKYSRIHAICNNYFKLNYCTLRGRLEFLFSVFSPDHRFIIMILYRKKNRRISLRNIITRIRVETKIVAVYQDK